MNTIQRGEQRSLSPACEPPLPCDSHPQPSVPRPIKHHSKPRWPGPKPNRGSARRGSQSLRSDGHEVHQAIPRSPSAPYLPPSPTNPKGSVPQSPAAPGRACRCGSTPTHSARPPSGSETPAPPRPLFLGDAARPRPIAGRGADGTAGTAPPSASTPPQSSVNTAGVGSPPEAVPEAAVAGWEEISPLLSAACRHNFL